MQANIKDNEDGTVTITFTMQALPEMVEDHAVGKVLTQLACLIQDKQPTIDIPLERVTWWCGEYGVFYPELDLDPWQTSTDPTSYAYPEVAIT